MNRTKFLLLLFLLSVLHLNCSGPQQKQEQFNRLYLSGNFNEARQLLQTLKPDSADSVLFKVSEILAARMERIEIDFSKTETQIKNELEPYFTDLNDAQLRMWESENLLEMRMINGERKYFKNAVSNLFRLDSIAKNAKILHDGNPKDSLSIFCVNQISELLNSANGENDFLENRHKFKVDFTITLKPDVVPAGELVKCWMPFPRESLPRQKNLELIEVNSAKYRVANNALLQRSLYIEKVAEAGKPTVFYYSAEFETSPQYVEIRPGKIKPYDTGSEIFREYTKERPPHIVFSDEIKRLTEEITARISDPFEKVKAIYYWINNHIKWASALEYSTFDCIPEYVLKNRHGDCGMQTLLFMSMAQYAGIPCKWQSGWMLHPGNINLHDWCEVYYEGIGWVPLDQSFGLQESEIPAVKDFYISGIDAYRLIINDDFSRNFEPDKFFYRSEPIDFQRGELEWKNGNIYFNDWSYNAKFTSLF